MPEELAYARKASGLVRGLSFWDVLGIGLAFLTPIYAIWYVIGFSLSVYPRAQLVIAIVISVLHHRLGEPDRLGRPGRHHATKRRRVRLQLAHHHAGGRPGGELRGDPCPVLLEPLQRQPGGLSVACHAGPVPGLDQLHQLRDQQGRRHHHLDRRHRDRLPHRGLRHEVLPPPLRSTWSASSSAAW